MPKYSAPKKYHRLSLFERAVLEATALCPRPQLRCLYRKARKLYPKWGIDREDIIWALGRLRREGILHKAGSGGHGAMFYRYANNSSAAKRRARVLRGPTGREARRLLRKYYRRNPLRKSYYQIKFQKKVWKAAKRWKKQSRKYRLADLRAKKRRK